MIKYRTPQGIEVDALPKSIPGVDNPTLKDCAPLGWRGIASEEAAAAGWRPTAWSYVDEVPGLTLRKVIVAQVNTAAEAADQAAKALADLAAAKAAQDVATARAATLGKLADVDLKSFTAEQQAALAPIVDALKVLAGV